MSKNTRSLVVFTLRIVLGFGMAIAAMLALAFVLANPLIPILGIIAVLTMRGQREKYASSAERLGLPR